MKRNPIFVFNDKTSTGIYEVPLESIVQVIDSDGIGTPSMTQIVDKSMFYAGTTIQQYLATPSAYKNLDKYLEYLNDLKDVTLPATIDNNSVLQYNGVDWVSASLDDVASNIELGDLAGVNPAAATDDGKYLEWNETGDEFIYVKPVKEINELSNVDAPTPIADQILNWDDSTNKWVAISIIDGGSF